MRRVLRCLPFLLSAACHSLPVGATANQPHKCGEAIAEVRGDLGVPILQKALLWDGNGEVDNYGVGARGLYCFDDGLALGVGINGLLYKTRGHDTEAGEFELIGRGYLLRDEGLRVFWDLTGGWHQADHRVPDGGTQWGMTFSFGPGLELPLGGGTNLVLGGTFHHLSNALGRHNDRNPSQNEGRFFVGFGIEF